MGSGEFGVGYNSAQCKFSLRMLKYASGATVVSLALLIFSLH